MIAALARADALCSVSALRGLAKVSYIPIQDNLGNKIEESLSQMEKLGTLKRERVLTSAQGAWIRVAESQNQVLNFCANNYLGLGNHPKLVEAAKTALDTHGFGLASVRFICGTQNLHKQLEETISRFHHTQDTILYASCFDANAGLFETLLTKEDAVISDTLNHASIIDGIRLSKLQDTILCASHFDATQDTILYASCFDANSRLFETLPTKEDAIISDTLNHAFIIDGFRLCKAQRFRYRHMDMAHLDEKLRETQSARMRLIVTDGVFSMDGDIAPLKEIVELAKKHNAQVFVDDCHATGILGPTGRGTDEACGVLGQVDIINSTLGKALGGATGGYTTGRPDVVALLRQKSRPYLFSNTLAPSVAAASQVAFEMLESDTSLKEKLEENTRLFRSEMADAGFSLGSGTHPIVPIMLGEAHLAAEMAKKMLEEGIYVIGFSYPVVPKGSARVRVQISAAHSSNDIKRAVAAFKKVAMSIDLIA